MNFVGSKFRKLGKNRFDIASIAHAIKLDLKEAFGAKYRFNVTSDKKRRLITIFLKQMLISDKRDESMVEVSTLSDFNEKIISKILSIANAYNYDDSNIFANYINRNYHIKLECSVYNSRLNNIITTKFV